MNRTKLKELLAQFRNGLAFCFSWLVICIMILAALNGKESISTGLLFKIFALSVWAVFCFIVCFKEVLFSKKRFIFRLNLFCGLFIPVEILMFFMMGLFKSGGSVSEWIFFMVIIAFLYVICVLIDWIVGKKQGEKYTNQLLAYNRRRTEETHGNNTDN